MVLFHFDLMHTSFYLFIYFLNLFYYLITNRGEQRSLNRTRKLNQTFLALVSCKESPHLIFLFTLRSVKYLEIATGILEYLDKSKTTWLKDCVEKCEQEMVA